MKIGCTFKLNDNDMLLTVRRRAVPEPGSPVLLGAGFAGLALVRRRRNRAR